jgi:hypothetical protein
LLEEVSTMKEKVHSQEDVRDAYSRLNEQIFDGDNFNKVEEVKAHLIAIGSDLRLEVSSFLHETRKLKVNFRNALRRTELKELETTYHRLHTEFILYDETMSHMIVRVNLAKEARYMPMEIGPLVYWAIKIHLLTSQREIVRALLQDAASVLNNFESQANNLVATSIAIAAFITSVLLALASLAISIIQLYLSSEPISIGAVPIQ